MKNKATLENEIKQHDDAINNCIKLDMNIPADRYYNKANVHVQLGRLYLSENDTTKGNSGLENWKTQFEKAEKCCGTAIEKEGNNRLYYVKRAEVRSLLEKYDEAFEDMHMVSTLPASSGTEEWYIKQVSASVAVIKEMSQKIEALPEGDPTKPILQAFANILQEVVVDIGFLKKESKGQSDKTERLEDKTKELEEGLKIVNEYIKLREGKCLEEDIKEYVKKCFGTYSEKLESLLEEMKADVERQLAEIRLELDQKLQNHDKVLEGKLAQLNLTDADKTKIIKYYKAFTGTIASLYTTAQVVDSGQVETKKGLTVTLIASLLPLISISGDFVKVASEPVLALIKAAITGGANLLGKAGESAADGIISSSSAKTAKQIKQLANDSSALSELVCQEAITIVEDQYKRNQIINTTTEDLKEMSDNNLKALKDKLKISMKQIKKFFNGEMYSTVAAQLGHKDGKALIEKYLLTDNSHTQTDKSHAFKLAAQDIVKGGGFYVVTIDELHNEVSQGLCTDKLKELFNTTHLKSKLQNSLNKTIEEISDKEIKKAQIITFKLLCKAVKEALEQNKAIACVEGFAKVEEYHSLVKEIAKKHPEYFCTLKIAEAAITKAVPNTQEQTELLTDVFNKLIKDINNIEIALNDSAKDLRDKVCSNRTWTDVKELFSEKYLKDMLKKDYPNGNISDEEVAKAKMVMFKHMCKAIKAAPNTAAIDCVKEFAETKHSSLLPTNKKEHKDLLVKIVTKHPEYFCTLETAEVAIKAAIPKNTQKQAKLLTVVFNELIKDIYNIKIALNDSAKYLRDKVSSNVTWEDVKELFSKASLKKVLEKDYPDGNVSGEEINKATMVMFEHMCEVTTDNNMACVEGFVLDYRGLLVEIEAEGIVKKTIIDPKLQQIVLDKIASNNYTGKGYDERQEDSCWHDYWYEYSKKAMDQLLELRLESAGIKDAKIVSADYVFDESSKFDFARDLLAKIPSEFAVSNNITKLLIAINLYNKHWVGLVIKRSSDKITARYVDSEGNSIPEVLKDSLESELIKLYSNSHIEITEQQVQSQKYNNCGLEVIENLIAICGGLRITEDEALVVHSLLFENMLKEQKNTDDSTVYNIAKISEQHLLGEGGIEQI